MRSPRAAEKRRIGMEMRPKVRWPFQTVEAMMALLVRDPRLSRAPAGKPQRMILEATRVDGVERRSKIKLHISNEIRKNRAGGTRSSSSPSSALCPTFLFAPEVAKTRHERRMRLPFLPFGALRRKEIPGCPGERERSPLAKTTICGKHRIRADSFF